MKTHFYVISFRGSDRITKYRNTIDATLGELEKATIIDLERVKAFRRSTHDPRYKIKKIVLESTDL